VQALYLGFSGSMADARWLQHQVTDRVASPPAVSRYHAEKLVFMPHSYFVTDQRQADAYVLHEQLTAADRQTYGLPKDVFVFASFVQLYKVRR